MFLRHIALCCIGSLAGSGVGIAARVTDNAAALRTEVQIGLCSPLSEVVTKLRLRDAGPVTTTWLFDDATLSLQRRGLRLRLRMDARTADLTLKIADQDCAQLPADAIPEGQGKCELDMHGASIVGAVSLSQPLSRDRADALVAGRARVQDALSPAQSRFLREVVRVDPLPAALLPLGPLAVASRKAANGSYALDITTLPNGDQFLELTRKVNVDRAESTRNRIEQELARQGVEACVDQSGQAAFKMRKLLPR
ncbi:MAG: hypothetical protein ABI777_03125 [Betaproteobacteria bacterium]